MPRIRIYYNEVGSDNDPLDYCIQCWDEALAEHEGNPLAVATGDDHPPYNDTDYECPICHKLLTDRDN